MNGNGTAEKAREMFRANPGLPREVVAAEVGKSPRWAGNIKAEVKAENGSVVAVPVARPKPAATSTKARHPAMPKPAEGADDRLEKWLRRGAAWGLSAIALAMSYSHTKGLVVTAGVSWPAFMPLTVDLLMVVGWLSLRRHPRYLLARAAVVTGVAGSLALNAIAARPELVATDDVRLWTYLAVPTAAVLAVHLALKR